MSGPYRQLPAPFQIGLKPLDLAEWIDADENLAAYLDEKARVLADHFDEVVAAEPGTAAAQAELLGLLAAHLPDRFPELYRRDGNSIEIIPAGRRIDLSANQPPLLTAAQLVQEDLVLMRRGETGWRLAAAVLAFPSSWSLREKFGKPMHEVHGPVPGFGPDTRNAGLIERMFDHLKIEIPVIRWNWSLFSNGALYHPESAHPQGQRFGAGERADKVVLRLERQTLRKLPQSQDIVFTIRIHIHPIAALETHPDARVIAATLIAQLTALSDEQARYKGLLGERERLLSRLSEMLD